MNARVNPFEGLKEVPAFAPKPKPEIKVAREAVDRLAEDNNFPSRQAARSPKEPKRKKRVYTTGRNVQFNLKAKPETLARFNRLADEAGMSLVALFERAVDALERERNASRDPQPAIAGNPAGAP